MSDGDGVCFAVLEFILVRRIRTADDIVGTVHGEERNHEWTAVGERASFDRISILHGERNIIEGDAGDLAVVLHIERTAERRTVDGDRVPATDDLRSGVQKSE